jgi:uncharacterized protein
MATAIHTARRSTATIYWVAFWLLVIGGVNWGLVGLFEFDLVAAIFGAGSPGARIIYTLVGISAVYCAIASLRRSRDVI